MKKIIAIANQKGGVGKTTTAINLASCVALSGRKTLLIDVDPQGNCTSGIGVTSENIQKTVYDVFVDGKISAGCILKDVQLNLDLIPSETDLFGIDVELMKADEREFILKKALKKIQKEYDYIFIDCPPSLTLLTVNALSAADAVLIPVQAQYYALEGLTQLLKTIDLFREGLNAKLEIEGFVLTMFEQGNALAQSVKEDLMNHFKDKVYQTLIHKDPRLSESPSFGKPIASYDVRTSGAEDYIELTREFLERTAAPVNV